MEMKLYKNSETFKEEAKKLDVIVTDEQIEQFRKYYAFLVEENEKYNLTAITDENDVWLKHFLDCLAGAAFFPKNATVCDVGSGAGFPAPLFVYLSAYKLSICFSSLKESISTMSSILHSRMAT